MGRKCSFQLGTSTISKATLTVIPRSACRNPILSAALTSYFTRLRYPGGRDQRNFSSRHHTTRTAAMMSLQSISAIRPTDRCDSGLADEAACHLVGRSRTNNRRHGSIRLTNGGLLFVHLNDVEVFTP